MLTLTIAVFCLLAGATSKIIRMPLIKAAETVENTLLRNNVDDADRQDIIYNECMYYSKIGFGNPQQHLRVTFNTEESTIWVISSYCSNSHKHCQKHNKYNHSQSATYIRDGHHFSLAESNIIGSGFLSMDSLHVAGMEIRNQTFGEVTSISKNSHKVCADASLGMAFNSSSLDAPLPPVYKMYEQKLIDSPEFSVYFSKDLKKGGQIIFGGTDPHYHDKEFNYVPLIFRTIWSIRVDDIKVKDQSLCRHSCIATIGTATPFIRGPKPDVEKLAKLLGAKWDPKLIGYTVHCSSITNRILRFVINGVNYDLQPQDYVYKKLSKNSVCLLAITHLSHGKSNHWVLGSLFIRKFYTKFDVGYGRIGLVEAVHPEININD